ncbi:hypothetical protein FF38_00584 [Lucilia cuprina]|uniref:Uncharacterized protein n=1 Tax=Lucilia cuprina TaxID=7375 RepID=A0A0L0BQI3_LUCCU|nr:hypothetical protein FF38_00584 [Lucilia cuprina]
MADKDVKHARHLMSHIKKSTYIIDGIMTIFRQVQHIAYMCVSLPVSSNANIHNNTNFKPLYVHIFVVSYFIIFSLRNMFLFLAALFLLLLSLSVYVYVQSLLCSWMDRTSSPVPSLGAIAELTEQRLYNSTPRLISIAKNKNAKAGAKCCKSTSTSSPFMAVQSILFTSHFLLLYGNKAAS